jgi:hypothetical protein
MPPNEHRLRFYFESHAVLRALNRSRVLFYPATAWIRNEIYGCASSFEARPLSVHHLPVNFKNGLTYSHGIGTRRFEYEADDAYWEAIGGYHSLVCSLGCNICIAVRPIRFCTPCAAVACDE